MDRCNLGFLRVILALRNPFCDLFSFDPKTQKANWKRPEALDRYYPTSNGVGVESDLGRDCNLVGIV